MFKLNIIFTIFIFFFTHLNAKLLAAQLPRYLGSEKKFRSYIYNPNELYRYFGHYTYQGFIEFEPQETINTISMGNPTLWLVETLDNRLFLKPVGEDNSETNMTVLTDKRVYHFELVAKEAKGLSDKDLIFVVKFSYPDEKDRNILEFAKSPKSDEPDLRDLSRYNFNYQYTGEKLIAPTKVFDDGIFTYIEFASNNSEAPAIYSVDSEGFETLVNYRISGKYIIVEKVAPQYTLRNGNEIVCLYNMETYTNGTTKKTNLLPNNKNFKSNTNSFENPAEIPFNNNPNPNPNQTNTPNMPNYGNTQNPNAMMPNSNPMTAPNELMPKSPRSRALGLPF